MILHIMMDEKFTVPFVSFVNEYFDNDQHSFLIMSSRREMRYAGAVKEVPNVVVAHKNLSGFTKIVKNMITADKIILHGMFTPYIVYLLDILSISGKTYWYIWGGDLYDYQKESPRWNKVKTRVISRLCAVITPLEGDYQLARIAYHAQCKWLPALLPTTTIADADAQIDFKCKAGNGAPLKILLGNSADSENRHVNMLDKLACFAEHDIHIYIPLSYGDQEYAHEVASYAEKIFGSKVTPMFDFMPLDQYKAFLRSIDVAIFAHKRQQAFSNIIQLVSMGTKVYLNQSVSPWKFLTDLDVQVYDTATIQDTLVEHLTAEQMHCNKVKITERCSMSRLIEEWQAVFEYSEK